jgi:hypothetical protein
MKPLFIFYHFLPSLAYCAIFQHGNVVKYNVRGEMMAKDKKRSEDGEKKDLTFYYEIVGIITILIATITLARLGNSGEWLMIFFKLLFGDWYFLILVLLMLYGLRSPGLSPGLRSDRYTCTRVIPRCLT